MSTSGHRASPPEVVTRPEVAAAKRVVVKVGTRVLTHDDGSLALARLFAIMEELGAARRAGRQVLLVTSGAVGLGRESLKLAGVPTDLAVRQACAAVGQSRLMALYQEGMAHFDVVVGQVLLSAADFAESQRYANLERALESMLARGVLPVINENDVVATDELALDAAHGRASFGDNDELSALVAQHLKAQLLLVLTDVDGVYDRDPKAAGAQVLARLDDPSRITAGGPSSAGSKGGMQSKLKAAARAAGAGCHVVIASGRRTAVIASVLAGEPTGTLVPGKLA